VTHLAGQAGAEVVHIALEPELPDGGGQRPHLGQGGRYISTCPPPQNPELAFAVLTSPGPGFFPGFESPDTGFLHPFSMLFIGIMQKSGDFLV
jgi:hypothetical protein